MENYNLQEAKLFKDLGKKYNEFEAKVKQQMDLLEKNIKQISNHVDSVINNKKTKTDILTAYNTLRIDIILGTSSVSKSRLKELGEYIKNIDYDNIPEELKEYL